MKKNQKNQKNSLLDLTIDVTLLTLFSARTQDYLQGETSMSEKQQQELIRNHYINKFYEAKNFSKSEADKMYYQLQIEKELKHQEV